MSEQGEQVIVWDDGPGVCPACGEDAEHLLLSGAMGEDMPCPDEVAVCEECWPKGWYKLDENEQVRRVPLEKGPWTR